MGITRRSQTWLVVAVSVAALAAIGLQANAVTIVKGPYLQNVTQTSIVVMWETDVASTGQVDYGPGAGYYRGAATDPRVTKLHEVHVTDLMPNSLFHYRAVSGDAVSDDAMFRTAPPPGVPFRFVVYGDSRSEPQDHAKVVRRMMADRPRLVVHTGDIVGNGNDYDQWRREFFEPAAPLIRTVPIATCLGNHENNSHWYYDFFSNPADSGSEAWYAFRFGDVRFICLDPRQPCEAGSPQHEWLQAALAEPTDAVWTIAFFHYPPYASGGHKGDEKVQQRLVPLLEKHHVDIVFNGHCHNYERSVNNGVVYVTAGGGGAGLAGVDNFPNPHQVYAESCHHHCLVEVDGGKLTCRGVRAGSGETFDEFTLTHPNASQADKP